MEKHYERAMELKYLNHKYADIAEILKSEGTEISIRTIEDWFTVGGTLEIAYEQYSKQQNELQVERAQQKFKKHANEAADAIITVLRRALKKKQDYRVIEAAGVILDRAKSVNGKGSSEGLSYDELRAKLIAGGVDPDSITVAIRSDGAKKAV